MQKKKGNYQGGERENLRVGILTSAISRPSLTPLSNFIDILSHITPELYLISGNEGFRNFKNDSRVQTFGYNYVIERSSFLKICNFLSGQLRCSYFMIRLAKKVDVWIFFTGGEYLVLPMFIARLLHKPVTLYIPGSAIRDGEFSGDSLVFIYKYFSKITRKYADRIIIYSENLIKEWDLEPYRHKILIAHRHFLDKSIFTVTIPLSNRPLLIGYIGRFSAEKGVQHFVQALPAILREHKEIKVLIGGDGELKENISTSIKESGLTDRVELICWISHNELPLYLNKLRLLVLPSYTEGLPNIMLEAMACGTPVLATPVGAIPDVIRDGRTGFIMKDNSPQYIAENVIRALECPDLARIAENGRNSVLDLYTFEKTVDRWKKILITFKE
jgi:glycosyltransferase involved in cell wall biosynthesis